MKHPAFLHYRGATGNPSGPCPFRYRGDATLGHVISLVWLAVSLLSPGSVAAETCQKGTSTPAETYFCIPEITVDDVPLYLLKGATPNLLITLDTSGSMKMGGTHVIGNMDARDLASATNPVYYDPEITYLPPKRAEGESFTAADFDNAPGDFFRNQFCTGCDASKLKGALDSENGWRCDSLCANQTECYHDLDTEYVAVIQDSYGPCVSPTVSRRGEWSLPTDGIYIRDPGYTTTPLPTPADWAMRCMYSDVIGAENPGCPAYYYRTVPEYIDNQGLTIECPEELPTYPATVTADTLKHCLQRVIVGSVEDSIDATTGISLGGDIAHTSERALAERRKLLRNCPGDGGEVSLARCNFANWYAFYRTRWRTLQSGMTLAIADLNQSVRVGYQGMLRAELTKGTSYFDDQLFAPFGSFVGKRREWFQHWLFATLPSGNTPLIESARRVLNFCSGEDAYLPDPHPGADVHNNEARYCRNNFHLLFTDGAWDTPIADAITGIGNADGSEHTLPNSTDEESVAFRAGITEYPADGLPPFGDKNSNGLADIAFYSWITDLRPTDDELVPTRVRSDFFSLTDRTTRTALYWNPAWDPADWQHITTYTVGFGLQGAVTPDPSPDKLGVYGTADAKNLMTDGFPTWTGPNDADKVDDLWHAGLNGRGAYWSANNPQTLIAGFKTVVTAVNEMTDQSVVAGTAPAINTGGVEAPRVVFQALFDPDTWKGDLRAFRISGGQNADPCKDLHLAKGKFCDDPTPDPDDPWKLKNPPPYWSAADHLGREVTAGGVVPTPWDSRTIVTGTRDITGTPDSSTAKGVAFAYDKLSAIDQAALVRDLDDAGESAAQALIAYIRGSDAGEDNVLFRKRTNLLGDIINSTPVVVSAPHRAYAGNPNEGNADAGTDYASWAKAGKARKEIVYVGANDGMLHAFATGTGAMGDASRGKELFAYIPRPLFPKLYRLAEPNYGSEPPHTSFVDGPVAEGDAYFKDSWRSVVVGALGLGAQAVYAIESPSLVTDAGTGVETKPQAADMHLWDFTDQDDVDMGYVLGKPSIARVLDSTGKTRWVAIFSNGVNSSEDDGRRATGCTDTEADLEGLTTCGQGVLYVVPMDSSTLDDEGRLTTFAKFNTQIGRKDDPLHLGLALDDPKEPNGLSQPAVIGRNLMELDEDDNPIPIAGGELIATAAYAGDLFGNLWRFNLMNLDLNNKTLTATLIFQAEDQEDTPNRQPITAPVALAPHPTGVGTIVLFGTGRYLGGDDRADTSVQTFYGIWDRVAEDAADGVRSDPIQASELQRQYFKKEYAVASADSATTIVSYGRTSTRINTKWAADPAAVKSGEHMGWRIDLGTSTLEPADVDAKAAANTAMSEIIKTGERVVVAPQVRGERVVFVSLVPEIDVCKGGGQGWVNTLAYASGAALDYTPYDFNQDGTADSEDQLTTGATTSEPGTSIRLEGGGVYSGTTALSIGEGENKVLASDSKGKLVELLESTAFRWRVWRQVR